MRRRPSTVVAAAAALALVTLSACSDDAEGGGSDAGELVIGLSTFAEDVLDPVLLNGSTTRALLGPMFDNLINVNRDGELAPGVIDTWTPNEDASVWTLHVRSGIEFHDDWGEATAEDVAFTLNRFADAEEPTASTYATAVTAVIKKVRVVDPSQVEVTLVTPDAQFPAFLSAYNVVPPLVLLPMKYIEEEGVEAFRAHPVGSGPYEFQDRTTGSEVRFVATDEYWGERGTYESLTYRLLPEESSRIASLQSGELDVTEVSADGSIDAEAAGSDIRTVAGATQVTTNFGQVLQQDGPTADPRVREALSLAINRDELISELLPGAVLPSIPGMLPGMLDFDFDAWKSKAEEAYRFDPEEARSLLSDAGYPNGFDLTLYAYELAGAALPQIAQSIADYWRAVGVDVEYRAVDFAAFGPWRDAEPYAPQLLGHAYTHRWPLVPNPATYFEYMYDNDRLFRMLNDGKYTSAIPEVQDLLDRLPRVVDSEERTSHLDQLGELTYQEFIVVPIAEMPAVFAVNPDVDWDPNPSSYVGSTISLAKPAG